VVEGAFNDTKRQAFTGQDLRFTTRGQDLYAIALAWPGPELRIKSLGASAAGAPKAIKSVELLGHPASLQWSRTPDALVIQMPKVDAGDHAYAFRIRT
jgi:alpha-L-fucosidase